MQQLSGTRAGSFAVLGFAGNSAPDHVDHLHAHPPEGVQEQAWDGGFWHPSGGCELRSDLHRAVSLRSTAGYRPARLRRAPRRKDLRLPRKNPALVVQRTQRKKGGTVSVLSVLLTSSLCSRREDFGTPHTGGVLASSRWWSVAKATRHHRFKSAKIAGAPAGRRIRLRK
jgi:hypothetical protein